MRIATNMDSLYAQRNLSISEGRLSQAIKRLSSGYRINSAKDDPGGLSLSERIRSQMNGLYQANANVGIGITMVQSAEAGLDEIHSMLQRMRELALESTGSTITDLDRSDIQEEVDQLRTQIEAIASETSFNAKKLLNGNASALWTSSDPDVKLYLRGGLRTATSGKKTSKNEGNFNLTLQTIDPGAGQVLQGNIWKVQNQDVMMNRSIITASGIEDITVNSGLPAGDYTVRTYTSQAGAENASAQVLATYRQNTAAAAVGLVANVVAFTAEDTNASFLFEILNYASATGITFQVSGRQLTRDLSASDLTLTSLILSTTNVNVSVGGVIFSVLDFVSFTAISNGDRFVVNVRAGISAVTDDRFRMSNSIDTTWASGWSGEYTVNYVFSDNAVSNTTLNMRSFYLNSDNGTYYDAMVSMQMGNLASADPAATFEKAYQGEVAASDVSLYDIDAFWGGSSFALSDPGAISLIGGDGKRTSVSLNSSDTIQDVVTRLNNAIADDLGHRAKAGLSAGKLVSHVKYGYEVPGTFEDIAGTLVFRSALPGSEGEISISGATDLVDAFGLAEVKNSKDPKYAWVAQKGSPGTTIRSGRSSGTLIKGALHDNADVMIPVGSGVSISWDDSQKGFRFYNGDSRQVDFAIKDNVMEVQSGAYQNQRTILPIGSALSDALGLDKISVMNSSGASKAITTVDRAIELVSRQRGTIGGYAESLEYASNNLTNQNLNMKSAYSLIRDADVAAETTNMIKEMLIQQVGAAALAQANLRPASVINALFGAK